MIDRSASAKILVAIDPSKSPLDPLRLAEKLARCTQLPLVLVTVFPQNPLLDGAENDRQRASAREELLELGRSLDGVVVDDTLAVPGSSPARALYELGETGATMIVVGSTSRGAVRRVLPGSVAVQLLSGAAFPVAVAPQGYSEEEDRGLTTVGVGFDGHEESQQALAGARQLARRSGARLRIITAVQQLAFGGVPASMSSPAASANRVMEDELRRIHDAALTADQNDVEGVFLQGNATSVLLEQSREVDLLVTGSRGYGPLGAVLLGSTTRELTQSAECPIIVVPRGRSLDFGDEG